MPAAEPAEFTVGPAPLLRGSAAGRGHRPSSVTG